MNFKGEYINNSELKGKLLILEEIVNFYYFSNY